MVIMNICAKVLGGNGKNTCGFAAYKDAEDNVYTTFGGSAIHGDEFALMIGTLINDIAIRAQVSPREVLKRVTEATYCVESVKNHLKHEVITQ